jgi:peroxiredoxin/predicted O-methyltransferase YrrM
MSSGSDRRIYDIYIAARGSAALAVAVRIGLFDLLERGPLGSAEIARRLELAPRPVALLCRVLAAMGLLERADAERAEGGRLRLADDARAHLVRGRAGWLGGLIELEMEAFVTPAMLMEVLRSGRPSVYGDEDPWQRHARDPARARAFTAAMHSISEGPARALADSLDLAATRRLLDVGGGSGAYAIALARRWPELECTIFDLPAVCEIAREYVERAGLAGRIRTVAGDFLREPFPAGHDAVLFSQILHDWSPETGRALAGKAAAALAPGGLAIVHEKLVSDAGPLANALVDVDMLVWTEGQQWSGPALHQLFAAAGFADVETRPTAGYWSAVVARRAAIAYDAARERTEEGDRRMAIKVGDRVPKATLKRMTGEGIKDVSTDDLFRGKKVVLFAVPGAFTPTCSARHLPGFVDNAEAIRRKGVDKIVCVSVNDAFVMDCWGKDRSVGDRVELYADGNAEFTRAMGLELDASGFGMGLRSQRYAAVIDDGVVKQLLLEKPGKFEVSSAEKVLEAL